MTQKQTVRFVAEYDDSAGYGALVDVTLYFANHTEPFCMEEFRDGTPTRKMFEAAWEYFDNFNG